MAQRSQHLELAHEVLNVVVRHGLVKNLGGKVLMRFVMLHLFDLGKMALADGAHVGEDVPKLPVRLKSHRLDGAFAVEGGLPLDAARSIGRLSLVVVLCEALGALALLLGLGGGPRWLLVHGYLVLRLAREGGGQLPRLVRSPEWGFPVLGPWALPGPIALRRHDLDASLARAALLHLRPLLSPPHARSRRREKE